LLDDEDPEETVASIDGPKKCTGQRGNKGFAWPIIGKPHPLSLSEQRLSRHLNADSDLRGLFQFNWPIETYTGNHYIVDLFCKTEKLIIEVDGYSTHSGRTSFQADRDRDFSLTVDGYTVVRLTHAEVMGDIDRAISKIRSIMRLSHLRFDKTDL